MTAQYRPLIMLAVGITFVYLIISLHSAPYPYPQNIIVSREDLFGKVKPNGIFISVQEDWVYLTAIWKEHEVNYEDATGLIRQYRRPLHLILSDNYDSNNNWQLLYNHRLDGPITHISSFYYNDGSSSTNTEYNENNALAILYQLHGKEEIKYIIRFYHIGNYEDEINDANDLSECQKLSSQTCHIKPSFKYQDIILPGTTSIKSFYVDGSIILYSRSPDDAKFRTILIPENIFDISKSGVDALTLKSSDPGPLQKIGRLEPITRKTSTFRRVYAVSGVIRVLNVEVTATDEIWTFQVTVIHNSSSSEETNMRYRWRTKKLIAYTPPSPKKIDYDQFEFVRGISLVPIAVPNPVVVTAKNVTTICIALNNILFTFDYSNTTTTTTTDSNQQDTNSTEAFIVRSEYLPVLEESPFQVVGTEINANGNLLVLVTQENYILIYKRGDADINIPSSAQTRKGWFAGLIVDTRQNFINRQTEDNWELRMVIPSPDLDFLSQSDLDVIAVKILNVSRFQNNGNVLLNLYENGDIATFDLNNSEQESKFWFVIRKQWHMYIGMFCVVLGFVWNEAKMG